MSKQTTTGNQVKAGSFEMPAPPPKASLTYNSYLKIDELTNLQNCLSDPNHHDEPLFIIIHQAYELWFKLILHELDTIYSLLKGNKVRQATFFLRRIATVFRLLVQQIHILETMKPKDFLGFRYSLNPASGFQSSQFREIEFSVGLKEGRLLEHFEGDKAAYERLKKRFENPSLKDVFYTHLRKQGFSLPETESDGNDAEQKRISELIKIYDDPEKYADLYDLAESLMDIDELIFLWRTHHVTVVERIIGFKRGTGGSEGVGYLRSTLDKRAFPDLWKLRTSLDLSP